MALQTNKRLEMHGCNRVPDVQFYVVYFCAMVLAAVLLIAVLYAGA